MKYRSWFSLIHHSPDSSSAMISVLVAVFFHHLVLQPLPVLSASGVMSGGRQGLDHHFDNNQEDVEDGSPRLLTAAETSAEEGQYYDDDPGVTFITEDDIYDDFTDGHPTTVSARFYGSRNHPHYQDGSSLKKLQERCPPLPQEPADVKLCLQTKCTSDSQCSHDGSIICCYNGCLHSCQHKVDPPRVFDWLEETQLKEDQQQKQPPEQLPTSGGAGGSLRQLMGAETTTETIAIPGGCFLTPIQYEHLKLFRQLEHVNSCKCLQGDVVCHVNATRL